MAELKGIMVEFTTNGRLTQGYLSKPENGTGTGIIILQEWWGLVGHIKKVADRFAASGYVALAPALYKGESTSSPDEDGNLMRNYIFSRDLVRTYRQRHPKGHTNMKVFI